MCSLFTTDQITLERGRSYFLNDFFARRLSQRFGLVTWFGSWVNQRDVARLYVGQPVEVTLDAEPGKVFTGEVSRILPRASLSKNTIQAKILLNEATPNFRPEMSVKGTFLLKDGAMSAVVRK